MIVSIFILTLAVHLSKGAAIQEDEVFCEINPLVYTNSPLVIPNGGNTFLYPEHGETTLRIPAGQTVDLVCPGSVLVVLGSRAQESVSATCISNIRFRILGERTLFTQVSCAGDAVAITRFTGATCESGGRVGEIGFSLTDSRFLRIILVCYDTVAQSPLYTYFDMTASIGNNAKGTPRPLFGQDNEFYNLGSRTVNQLYTRAVQRQTVNTLIGLSTTDLTFIDNGSWFFFARGHLTARADFFYPAQQNATFRYTNAAPQWQTFNGLNWNEIEGSTRSYASRNAVDLQVWTGIHGVTTLPHQTTGAQIPIYLFTDNGNRALPAPAIYWKVVYEPISRRGVALIGVNNPYDTTVASNLICPDVSSSLNWLTWNRLNITQGYSYACTVANLRRAVPYAPNLQVSGLLVSPLAMFLSLLIFFSFSSIVTCFKVSNNTRSAGCEYHINQLPNHTPLVLSLSTKEILYPNYGSSFVTLASGESVELDCPGTANLLAGDLTTREITNAKCRSGTTFDIAGNSVDIGTVLCSSRITSVARYTGASCWGNGREIEVGLQVRDGRWLQLLTSCFDDVARNVLYSRYILTKQIGNQITGGTSPTWSEGTFYNLGVTLNNIYPIANHRVTINRQVGLPDGDFKYVQASGHHYIARGHLIARTDYMYNAQQMQTYHYINSAPQWQTFNGYNWFYFERNLRNYAANNFVDLEVYTGTYGISTLPHEVTGEDVELYFFVDDNGNRAMPIPELFWKVAYDPINKAGVAVLGINNPYQTDIERSIICDDIADKLTWLTFDRFWVQRGYMYACTIDDLRRFVPNIPRFDVRSILN
ncbi:uncharacterized protein LOC108903541 [Anoplophora glabripennis]|uniref:uncharacterized protein LOC108903541 n=1 Tax=Anoplophora glabripennis TaxID=217634 RepID=UPI00087524A6|nr:uncharacterized protein LOC108903541 [Anoplophora glabripennis]